MAERTALMYAASAYQMPARWTSAALSAVMLLVAPAKALAEPPPVHVVLRYEVERATKSCPSAADLRARIAEQLGYDPFAAAPGATLEVRVTIAQLSGGPEARIEWFDENGAPQGERQLSSPDDDCAELGAGVAFAVAVQLQLRAGNAPPAPAPPPRLEQERPKSPAPAAVVAPRPSVLVAAGLLGRFGPQPGLAPGVRAVAAVGGRAWAFHLDAHGTLPTTERGRAGGFSARQVGLGAAPCFRRGVLDVCALGSLTLLSVRGEDVDQPKSPSAVGVGVGARLQLTLPWYERLAAVAHIDLLAELAPRDVTVNRERVWSTAPLGVAVGLDVGAIFR